MNDDVIARLTRRIYALEQRASRLEDHTRLRAAGPPPIAREPSPVEIEKEEPTMPIVPERPTESERVVDEANFVGTWLARAGILAILIGAGFAFKYGIDRGFIGPTLRVIIGLATAGALVGWSEWSRRRGWDLFSQAVAGGGVALAYLSILAAFQLYNLVSGPVAFAGLIAVTAGGGVLAAVHRSPALTVLSLVGAYLNPFLASHGGRMTPLDVFLYILAVDVILVFIATKRWSAVEKLALAGTILVFAAVEGRASTTDAFTFASLLFTLFMVPPFLRRTSSTGPDLVASLSASAIYFAYSEHLISVINPAMRGPFALIFATTMATLALTASSLRHDTTLARGLWARSIVAFVLFPPLAFHGFAIITAWAIEGAFLVTSGELFSSQEVSSVGFTLIGISSVVSLGRLAADYSPQRILLSGYSVPVITSICALIVAALVSKKGDPARSSAGGAAAVLSLAWLSAETIAAVDYRIGAVNRAQVAGFALSALWTLYGAAALAIGVRASIRWVRLGAAMLLGIVVAKLALSDAWMLRTGLRVGVFIGVGAVLLACSVMYQRLRHLIVVGGTHGDVAPNP